MPACTVNLSNICRGARIYLRPISQGLSPEDEDQALRSKPKHEDHHLVAPLLHNLWLRPWALVGPGRCIVGPRGPRALDFQ